MTDISDKPSRNVVLYRMGLIALLAVSTILYFVWRVGVLNPAAPVFSWTFLCVESLSILWGVAFVAMTLRLSHRRAPAAPQGLAVDVFVPTYNEPEALVRRTLTAAMAVRYPHETWLLDDGARPAMQALAAEMGCRYLARSINTHGKAGNLNNALAHALGDFVVVLDADHLALPEFLDETLGYFGDAKVAIVQTPQEFYNFNSFEHLGSSRSKRSGCEHALFHRVIQRERDCANAAMFSGSGAVLRRSALDGIGGFATGSVTEDMHTCVRLHARGWHSVFHAKTLSGGLAPADARSFRRQRLRWAQGAMQVFVQEKLWSMPGLSPAQRLAYLSHVAGNFVGWKTLLLAFVPSLVLLTNVSPISVSMGDYLSVFVPCFLINLLVFEELARGHGRFFFTEVHNLARCTPSVLSVFAAWRRTQRFQVTPKVAQLDRGAHAVVLPWVVAATAVAGLATGWSRVGTGATEWPEVTAMSVWALYALFNSIGVIRLARRCRLEAGREALFPTSLRANVQSTDGTTHALEVTGLAIDRAELRSAPTAPLPEGARLTLHASLDGRHLALQCTVTKLHEHTIEVQWNFSDEAERAATGVAVVSLQLRALGRFDRIDHHTVFRRWAQSLSAKHVRAAMNSQPLKDAP